MGPHGFKGTTGYPKKENGLVKGRIDLASCGFPIGWHFFDLLSYIFLFSFGLKDLFGGWFSNHCLFKGARCRFSPEYGGFEPLPYALTFSLLSL